MKTTISSPESEYRETVTAKGQVTKATTAGKQNTFTIQAEPSETRPNKVWASDEHANVLIDSTEGITIPEEARNSIVQGFVWACKNGPLCEQPLTNVKVKLLEAQVHEDSALRDPAQIARAISRAILGSVLTGKPALLEPIYKIELSTPTQWFGACANIITSRRGKIQSTEKRGDLAVIVGSIPVTESFGLTGELRSATSGHAFWQNTFSHWDQVPESIASKIIERIRAKRGLPPGIPKSEKFIDEQ
jgi:elongation factor 2